MIVLGICDNHESGAALAVDGRIVCAINEERLDRSKMSARFPWKSIRWVLKHQGLTPSDVDKIVFAGTVTPVLFFRIWKELHESIKTGANQFSYLLNLYIAYQVVGRFLKIPMWLEAYASRKLLKYRMASAGFSCPVETIGHHQAHALSAYAPSGMDPCLVVTADAMGDGLSLTVNMANNGRLTRLYQQSGLCAINTQYSRITQFLGFAANRHEGKIVGLAAHGEPARLGKKFARQMHAKGNGFNLTNYFLPQSTARGIYPSLAGESREDVSAALQTNLENQFSRFLLRWTNRLSVRNVALAGGIFANVKLNQRLREVCELENIYITPNMGDGGLCMGAALSTESPVHNPMPNVYLGSEYDEEAVTKALDETGLEYEKPEDLAGEIAGLLADKKVVGRFNGRMEFGPRALGNRSILCHAGDPTVMDWLNVKLKRTEFMPFAPTTLEEHAGQCYLRTDGTQNTWGFMNLCFDCTDEMKRQSPAAVHVDGTARPQVLKREDNPSYYAILEKYYQLTGIPTILNTSFNLHEEPIVETPAQAIRSFQEARLDALAIGPFLVKRPGA